MNAGGWMMMALTIGGMTALLAWCLYKVLSIPGSTDHLHSPADIDPGDA